MWWRAVGRGGEEDEEPGEYRDADGISAPFRPESISIRTETTTVDLLLSRLREGMLDLAPDFQRRSGIWSDRDQSRLVESLLLRIPISNFHLRFTPDEGRVHFRFVKATRRVHIAHIGRKLGI